MIISFVSGKGGVGKTLLAAALAKELSAGTATLLVDLDFFNRGLTSLVKGLIDPVSARCVEAPSAGLVSGHSLDAWRVVRLAERLWYLAMPELPTAVLDHFATADVGVLAKELKTLIERAAETAGCDSVVLDCHGGPDSTSFAACVLSDVSLLVSEPDRVTLGGTLHFVRQLADRADVAKPCDIRLVFNKVVPGFTARHLTRIYNRHLRSVFDGRRLLGIFPLEIYLTREFERSPFLTDLYPHSQLTRKTQLLLFDLFAADRRHVLPAHVGRLSRVTRLFRRVYLHPPAILNVEVVLRTVGTAALVVAALFVFETSLLHERRLRMVEAAVDLDVLRFREANPALFASDSGAELVRLLRVGALGAPWQVSSPLDNESARLRDYGSELRARAWSAREIRTGTLERWRDDLSEARPEASGTAQGRAAELLDRSWLVSLELSAGRYISMLVEALGSLIVAAIAWALGVVLLSWIRDLDRAYTRLWRAGRWIRAMGKVGPGVVLGVVAGAGTAALLTDLSGGANVAALVTAGGLWAFVSGDQLLKGYRSLALASRPGDFAVRVAAVLSVSVASVGSWYVLRPDVVASDSAPEGPGFLVREGVRQQPSPEEVEEVKLPGRIEATFPLAGRERWYRFALERPAELEIAVTSSGDPVVAVYTDEGFDYKGGDDDGGGGLNAYLSLQLEAGGYYVSVWNLSAIEDRFVLSLRPRYSR